MLIYRMLIARFDCIGEDTPVYSAALLLDPSRRGAYIKQNWPDEWYEGAVAGANTIWMEEYNVELPDNPPAVFDTPAAPVKHKDNQLALLMKYMEVKAGVSHY
jgi:hypothetical protein